jgi:Leucine-rich repeat (LRR) protein
MLAMAEFISPLHLSMLSAATPKLVTELNLASCGVNTLMSINLSVVPNLVELNLSFNGLSSIEAIGHVPNLTMLNVSFNELTALDGVEELTLLVTLNASHNALVDARALCGLEKLKELWLGHNKLKLPHLHPLRTIKQLERLVLLANPGTGAKEEHSRNLVLHYFPGVAMLDGAAVHPAEKDEAKKFSTMTSVGRALLEGEWG